MNIRYVELESRFINIHSDTRVFLTFFCIHTRIYHDKIEINAKKEVITIAVNY